MNPNLETNIKEIDSIKTYRGYIENQEMIDDADYDMSIEDGIIHNQGSTELSLSHDPQPANQADADKHQGHL